MPINELDRRRAAGSQLLSGPVVITTGDEPLIVDLLPTATPGYHWIVESLSLIAHLVTRAPADNRGFPPLTGLFLCPPATPIETLAQAQTSWNLNARPILLPMGQPGGDFASIAVASAAPFPFALTLAAGFKTTVPLDWFVRAIVTCVQGTATPGPGAGSIGRLYALAHQEEDDVCSTR